MVMRCILVVCFSMIVGSLSMPSSAADVPQADSDHALVVFDRVQACKGGASRFNVQ